MTEDELDAIEARANAATPGPWTQEPDSPFHVIVSPLRNNGDGTWTEARPAQVSGRLRIEEDGKLRGDVETEWYCYSAEDAAFIAASRADIPALVAEVRRLRGWAEALSAWTTNALDIATARRIPSADMVADGETINEQMRRALDGLPDHDDRR